MAYAMHRVLEVADIVESEKSSQIITEIKTTIRKRENSMPEKLAQIEGFEDESEKLLRKKSDSDSVNSRENKEYIVKRLQGKILRLKIRFSKLCSTRL